MHMYEIIEYSEYKLKQDAEGEGGWARSTKYIGEEYMSSVSRHQVTPHSGIIKSSVAEYLVNLHLS